MGFLRADAVRPMTFNALYLLKVFTLDSHENIYISRKSRRMDELAAVTR